MAEMKFIKRTVVLDGGSVADPSPDSFFDGEQGAHTFIIAAIRGGEFLTFPGTSVVVATFLNPRNAVVPPITGTIVDGAAVVTLSNACYELDGPFTLTISVNGAVIYECKSRVRRRSSTTAYDPTGEISVAALTEAVAEMRAATVEANTAADNANTAAANAENDYNALKSVIGLRQVTPYQTVNNYALYRSGLGHYDQNYRLVKYEVTAGDTIFVICGASTVSSYASYQFQSESNVSESSNPYVIGEPVYVATSSAVIVPNGAKYIVFSEKKTDSGNGIYSSEVIDDAKFVTDYQVPRMDMIDGHFLVRPVTPYQIATGWKLIDDGRCKSASGYKLVKYRTSPGGEYYIRGYTAGDILYQFQESYGVGTGSSNAITPPGPVTSSIEGCVTSPASGYYLIMSMPVEDTVSGMYELVDKDDLLPDYWETYLTNTVLPKIYANNVSVGSHGVSFVFFTDQHTQMKCGNLINRVCDVVAGDMLVNGGDIINGTTDKSAEITTIRKMMKAIPNHKQYVVRGNHDSNTNFGESSASNEISESEFYGLCLKPVEDKIVSGGKLYYYIDNTNQKVRYIVLDTKGYVTDIDDTQVAWMTARITELSNDWTVVIFAHKVYTSVDNIDPSGTKIINALTSISTGAKIACVVSGHAHRDQYYTIGGKFPVIITTALNAWQESTTQGTPLERTWGTVTEFAFDVFHIDTQAKQIKVTRIGAGSDRTFSYV